MPYYFHIGFSATFAVLSIIICDIWWLYIANFVCNVIYKQHFVFGAMFKPPYDAVCVAGPIVLDKQII